ncbi:MAG: glycosyltransferase family 4 protein [Patescibacteria group bacterium]
MKIAVNVTRDYVAGITSTNLNLLNHLLRNDHEFVGIELTDRIYMKGPALFRTFAPETFDHHIINLHHLPISHVMKSAHTLGAVQKRYGAIITIIRSVLRETKPDCVLLNGTSFIPWLISIAAQKEGIPILLWYAGVLTKETELYPRKKRIIFTAMERSIVRRAKTIIFPSQACRSQVEQTVMKRKVKNGTIIPNPVASTFMEPSVVAPNSERNIAAVGRYTPIKNFDQFFDVHKRLLSESWAHKASFVTNPSQRLSKAIPSDIEVLPPMTSEALKSFFLTQGLIVCPSHFETFGNAPMEAVCLGIPVLVNESMGCAEVLEEVGLASMVIDFDDLPAVTERIKELAGQHILPKQLTAIHRVLDYRTIGQKIEEVLINTAPPAHDSH